MKLKSIKQRIIEMSKMPPDARVPILMIGGMGIGKSQIVYQAAEEIAKEKDYNVIEIRLAQMEPGDIIGIPRERDGRTIWAAPSWWPTDGSGIIFFDELNRAPIDVRQAIFQVLTMRRIHTHILPPDYQIVVAINPSDSIYQVEELDPAMYTRFWIAEVEPELEEWVKYAFSKDFHKGVIQFVITHKELFYKPKPKGACPTPRSYEYLSNFMKHTQLPIKSDDFYLAVTGYIGTEAGAAFIKFMDAGFVKPVTAEEVLNKYSDPKIQKKLKNQEKDENRDKMYATMLDVAAYLEKNKLSNEQLKNFTNWLKNTLPETVAALCEKVPNNILIKLAEDKDLVEVVKNILNESN